MRIAFCYPPFIQEGRFPNLPQNRQFIYTASREVRPYPVVMASAATWLKNLGQQVLWLDGISRRMDWSTYEELLSSFNPDLIVLETKAPIMKKLWKYVNELKVKREKLKVVLVGDHVSYFPEESFKNSPADFVLTGGDYDFLMKNLVEHLEKGIKLEPERLRLNHNLDEAPIIDRELTRWRDYGEAYLHHPCAYVMFGRGCGIKKGNIGVCTFCSWQHGLWQCSARVASPRKAVAEVKNLLNLGVKEIFDDSESGVLADEQWLKEFYRRLKKEKLLGKIMFSSNARADQLNKKTCRLLKNLGYRLLKVGLESGNNQTLEKINKKEKIEEIISGVKTAKDSGLRVMLTVMTGYPWETEKEVKKTYETTRELMFYKTRAGDCLQVSVVTPYPGTPLWQQARKNGWLRVKPFDYEKFDMRQAVLKSKIDAAKWCHQIWSIQKEAKFIAKSGLTIKSREDVALLLRGGKSLLGHIKDYDA